MEQCPKKQQQGSVEFRRVSFLILWSATALNGTAYAGFEVEDGGNTEFGTVCFDVL